jgi:predicted heme/steroid binding protein
MANVFTTLGDLVYSNSAGAPVRRSPNITTTKMFLSQTGDGVDSAAPQWSAITAADVNAVPYTGATGNVDLGEYGLTAGYLGLELTPTGTPTTQGTMFWSADDETVDVILDSAVTLKLGQETFYYVKNQTGSTIAKGTIVMANGTVGSSGRITIEPFIADGTYPSKFMIGVTSESIINGADGFVTAFGKIRMIDTSAFVDGDILYASPSGGFTTTPPTAPNNIVTVAIVIKGGAANGTIFVRPTFGSNINEDEGVLITSPTNNQLLKYNSTSGLWENFTHNFVPNTRTLTLNGIGYDLSADRSWSTITSLTGEATASGTGAVSVTLDNNSVIAKVLTGLNTSGGGNIVSTDSIVQAFGKVQNQITALVGGVMYEGTWNASTNSPTITSSVGNKGDYYVVSTAGSTTIDGISDWKVGDWIIFNGSTWQKVDNTDLVSSVNGYTGAVVLTTSDVAEGTALYFTNTRAQNAITLTTTGSSGASTYTSGTLNIPNYSLSGLGGVPTTRTLTINGTAYDLSADRTWTIPTHDAVTIGTANGLSLSGQVLSLGLSSSTTNGALSSTDWTTFNSKQNALNGTGFVKISGTTISYDNSTYYLATNPSNYITLTSLSAGTGISYNNTTGVISSTITQYTDALARASISLTTTGSSGSSTYNSTTGVLNVPTYTAAGLGAVPTSRTITINDVVFDLSANREWSVGDFGTW